MRINYKPLTVNRAWKGHRFKTDAYKRYERDLLFLLPKMVMPAAPYFVQVNFGLKNTASDIDNPVKPFLDVLQKKYKINDKDIVILHVYKTQSDEEFINFTIQNAIV